MYVSQLISAFLDYWNVDLINSIFPPEVSFAIFQIKLSSPLGINCLSWPFSKNGECSVKSGMKVFQDSYPVVKPSSPSSSFAPFTFVAHHLGGPGPA